MPHDVPGVGQSETLTYQRVDATSCFSFLCLSWRRNCCPRILMDGQIFNKQNHFHDYNQRTWFTNTLRHIWRQDKDKYWLALHTNTYSQTNKECAFIQSNCSPPSPSHRLLVPLGKMPQFNALRVDNGIVDNTRIRRAMWAWAG